ncbi:Ig-like domain-containing protein [Sulfurimonas sp.]|jgi:hypothetical protein|uniref:Ig-like domain-containing protein n=1 Tax=Sulfurimonas sp. TaxID=2022749 RepID=UPI0025CE4E49|nr:Ig-like domain-containing protein [Sulfurimonas sp.]MBT5934228.1 Ig-like domain-containing protein [Sulfurimonas sp.]
MKKISTLLLLLVVLVNAKTHEGSGKTKQAALIDLSGVINSSVSSSLSTTIEETQDKLSEEVTSQSNITTNLDLVNISYRLNHKASMGKYSAIIDDKDQIKHVKTSLKVIASYKLEVLPKNDKDRVKTLGEWISKIDKTINLLNVYSDAISTVKKNEILKKSKTFTDLRTDTLLKLSDAIWKGCGEDKSSAYEMLNNKIFAKKEQSNGFFNMLGLTKEDVREVNSGDIKYIKENNKECAVLEKEKLLKMVNYFFTSVKNFNHTKLLNDDIHKYDQVDIWLKDLARTKELAKLFTKEFTPKHHKLLLDKKESLKKFQSTLKPQYVVFKVAGHALKVLIDGKQKFEVNKAIYLPVGPHSYVISSKGKCDITGEFTLDKKETKELEESFEGLEFPKVTFTSNKFKAQASINGQSIKINIKSEIEKCGVAIPYIITFEDQSFQGNIVLEAGKDISKNFNFLSQKEIHLFNDMTKKLFKSKAGEKLSGTLSQKDILLTKLEFEIEDKPESGNIDISTNGGFIYTPKEAFYGKESFSYYIVNNGKKSSLKLAQIDVVGLNHTPTLLSDSFNVDQGESLSASLKAEDKDGDTLTYSLATKTTKGDIKIDVDGDFVYTPFASFNGIDSFSYQVRDVKGATATKSVKINVLSSNSAPVTTPQEFNTVAGEKKQFKLAASDKDGDSLNYKLVVDVKHGSLTLAKNGIINYTALDSYAGEDSFSYIVSDGKKQSNTQVVTISVMLGAPIVIAESKEEIMEPTTSENVDYEKLKAFLLKNKSNPDIIKKVQAKYPKTFQKFINEMTH